MAVDLPPLHDDLTYLAPLGRRRAEALVGFVAGAGARLVVDAGCGWGELLLAALAAEPGARGVGIDRDADAIRHGRALASRRGIDRRVEFVVGDASELLPVAADAVICVGASHIWAPSTDRPEPLPYAAALAALRDVLAPGGRCLYADAIWTTEPTPAAMAPLGGRADEFVDREGFAALVRAAGFRIVAPDEAGLDEWDEFEAGFTAGLARWLDAHDDDHPDREAVARRLAEQRATYHDGYRGVLGFAFATLIAE